MSIYDSSLARFLETKFGNAVGDLRELALKRIKKANRELIRSHCKDVPGVYGFLNADGRIIYVGMSTSLVNRLPHYFPDHRRRTRDATAGRMAKYVIWQPVAHELFAQLRERELIRNLRPVRNVRGRPSRMRIGYLVLTDDPAPLLTIREQIPRQHRGVWGPLSLTKWTRVYVDALNVQFQLRDCSRNTPMHFADETQTVGTGCLRAEVKTCLAPCIRGCSKRQYEQALDRLRRFLNGNTEDVLAGVVDQMREASLNQQFEMAGKFRDRHESLTRLSQQLTRFHERMKKANYVYRLKSGLHERQLWVVVIRGHITEIFERPQDNSLKSRTIKRLDKLRAATKQAESFQDTPHMDTSLMLHRWFRSNKEERDRRWSLARAIRALKT